jgi:hypothetical protein
VNPKGGFAEFANRVPTLLNIQPLKKTGFMHIGHGSTAFGSAQKHFISNFLKRSHIHASGAELKGR